MSADVPIPNPSVLRSISGASANQKAKQHSDALAIETGPAFKALLDRLEGQAVGLRRESEQVQGPADLAGAVDNARASLSDALSLGGQLLEAYRAAQQQPRGPH